MPKPKPRPSLSAAAREAALAQLQPQSLEIERQRREAERRAQLRAEHIKGFGEALTRLVGEIPGQVEGTYSNAANQQALIAKGYSETWQQLTGRPPDAETMQRSDALKNLLYGAGGSIPANQLVREGAAFTSAARMLPATEAGRAQNALAAHLRSAEEEQEQFDAQMRQLQATYPELYRRAVMDLQEGARADRALDINEQYLLNTVRSTGAGITGFDPLTGQPTYDAAQDVAGAVADQAGARREAIGNRNRSLSDARKLVYELGRELRGEPMPSGLSTLPYVRKDSTRAKPEYTNDPKQAKMAGGAGWTRAVNEAWAAIDGDSLMARYRLTREQVIAQVIRPQLIRLGFRPPKQAKRVRKGEYGYPGSGVGGQAGG